MGLLRGTIFFLLLFAGIGFAILNEQAASIKYHFGLVSPPLPVFLWAFIFLLIGLIVSAIWASFSKLLLLSGIRQKRRMVEDLE
ncbi:MAG TPA: lipopolysaccharide assembly protein LapA domain-containing protein, partial [Thermodesulfobacteriota bacterium]|nr:lipopolysaccharide assembly protein LapA domain-containing protein [Thermodesulfobacteriota bacterium]